MEKKKQPKMNKAQLRALNDLIKSTMKISIKDLIDAIEQDCHGKVALNYYHHVISIDLIRGAIKPTREEFLSDEKYADAINRFEEAFPKMTPVLEKVFYSGLVAGSEIDNFFKLELENLKQLRDEEQSKQ